MNIENMEQEFPKMPQSMRDMIEKEVEKQVKVTPQKGYFSLKKQWWRHWRQRLYLERRFLREQNYTV